MFAQAKSNRRKRIQALFDRKRLIENLVISAFASESSVLTDEDKLREEYLRILDELTALL